jgi:hypothetical protein
MNKILIFFVILLSACSKLTNNEQLFVGKWSWNYEVEGFGESGFLNLKSTGEFSYLIESWNPTEELTESSPDEMHRWLLKDGDLCLSRASRDFVICRWQYNVTANGQPELFFKGSIIKGNIKASKSVH